MKMKKLLCAALAAVLLASCFAFPAAAEVKKSTIALVDAQSLKLTHVDDVINVVLLGIEYGTDGQHAPSANSTKKSKDIGLLAYHTDAVMVLSVNKTQGKISLISIPRDTLVYVPGVHGLYKMNNAFNAATTVKEGLRHVSDTVSWLLGGVKMDAYVAVDMGAMVALGDAMGGIDLNLPKSYEGTSGIHYPAGMQHLDGMGMMDYVRARKNIDSSDLNRTGRGREVMTAVIKKLWGDWNTVSDLWTLANSGKINCFTTLNGGDLKELYDAVQALGSTEIGSYVMEGKYDTQTTCGDFQFAITDQENRKAILKTVYGIDAEPLPYTSLKFIKWLFRGNGAVTEGETVLKNRYVGDGFDFVKHLHRGQQVLEYCYMVNNPNKDQKAALEDFEAVYNDFLAAFETAAAKVDAGDSSATIGGALKKSFENTLETLANAFGYTENIYYSHGHYWEQDPSINEYSNIDWR